MAQIIYGELNEKEAQAIVDGLSRNYDEGMESDPKSRASVVNKLVAWGLIKRENVASYMLDKNG